MSIKGFIKNFTYEKRTEYLALYSVLISGVLAIAKFILAYIFKDSGGGFFAISAIVTIFMLISRVVAYNGIKNKENMEIKTFAIFIFLLTTALVYILYMIRLFYFDTMHIDYPKPLGIAITAIAFFELILSIRSLFTVRGRGHFYRDIKMINLCSAILAIVLAQISLLSFSTESTNANIWDAIAGIVAGGIIIIISIFILISPKISIVDRGKRDYKRPENPKYIPEEIVLFKGIIYGRCYYKYEIVDDVIVGQIIREKSPFNSLRWYFKLIIIIFSVVIIFPYLIGAIINYFIVGYTPIMLDQYMEKKGYELIKEWFGSFLIYLQNE